MTDLSGVDLKLSRAKQHLELLEAEMTTLYGPGVIRLDHMVQAGGRIHAYAVQGLPPVPSEWGTIIGDCVHNARSALDHMAYEAVRALGGTPVDGPGGTTFPILSSGTNPPRLNGLSPVPATIDAVLESLQPRNPASGFVGLFLGVVSELDNRDKHRRLLLTQYANNELDLAWGSEPDMPRPSITVVEEEFANGDTVITLTYPKPFPQFDPTPRLPIRLLLEPELPIWRQRDRMSVDKLLGNIVTVVGRVVDKFRPLLP